LRTISIPQSSARSPFGSKRLLALAGDERLVDQIRRGNDAAFEVAFERYGRNILAFCRHMLGDREEAEDVVQHAFAAAYHDLQRNGERQIALKPWLYTIARNRCLSVLRARREHAAEWLELSTAGLPEQVERRAELRELLGDLRELPEEQRAALLLAEVGDLSHTDVAGVLGCEVARVKALVFRARSGLIQRRNARETPCVEIREQLANLRGGSLRRSELRHHLRVCPGCSEYRAQVARQRQMLALALPVAPSLGLKSSLLASVGAGGTPAAAGVGGTAAGAGGLSAALTAPAGGAALAKIAIVATLAGGGAVAGKATIDDGDRAEAPRAPAAVGAPAAPPRAAGQGEKRDRASANPGRKRRRGERRVRAHGDERSARAPGRQRIKAVPPGRLEPPGTPARGKEQSTRGRGPIEAPPAAPPVRRGPEQQRTKPIPPANLEVAPRSAPRIKEEPPGR
jgi:RNA polymerase sigma factor (sigma-70 family)